MARALFPRLGGAAPVHCVAAGDTGRPDPALSRAACATRRRAGGLLRVRRRRRLPPLFEPELLRFRQQLPYRRPLGCKLPVMGTRAAGGYVGMSEGWLGTVCALFLRSFNAATPLLIDINEKSSEPTHILVPEGTKMSALTVQVLRLSLSLGSVTAVNLRRSVCGAQGSLDR